jgi:hypothetical protein
MMTLILLTSNSASPPSTVDISRSRDVAVSAHVSPNDRKPALLPVMAARLFNSSRVDRAKARHRQRVARLKLVEQPAKLRAVGHGPDCHFSEHLLASRCLELGKLAGKVLDAGRDSSIPISQAKLAVRAETNKLEAGVIRLAVDEHEVRPNVTIAMIVPFAGQRMIEVASRQRLIPSQHVHNFHQKLVQRSAVPS